MKRSLYFSLLFLPCLAFAGPAEDWQAILAMDAGPKKKAATREEVQSIAKGHLLAQKRLVEQFLAQYPNSPNSFQAQLKQADLEAALGAMQSNPREIEQALARYTEIADSVQAPALVRADASFRRVGLLMQQPYDTPAERKKVITSEVNGFMEAFPNDIRGPRLLVEASTLYDDEPLVKTEFLRRAQRSTREAGLRARIEDDLKRTAFFGKPIRFRFSATDGKVFDSNSHLGKPLVIVFWAASSPHSLMWIKGFIEQVKQLPPGRFGIVGVSLDRKLPELQERMKELSISWPTCADGKGWGNALARQFGINALPTVWILDSQGKLVSLNARDDFLQQIEPLIAH